MESVYKIIEPFGDLKSEMAEHVSVPQLARAVSDC